MPGIIVTGISTEVGKTLVSAILVTLLKGVYWKPIEAGGSDTETVQRLSGVFCYPPAYRLKASLSPHHAALLEKRAIEISRVTPPQTKEPLIVEGAGGILTPLTQTVHLGELFATWNFSWVLVSKHYLGSMNHTLLSIAWLRSHQQQIAGIVFNGEPYPEAENHLLNKTQVPFLGRLLPEKRFTRKKIQWYATRFHTLAL